MTANQMRLAAKIVGGETIVDAIDSGDENEMGDDGNNFDRLYVSDSEDDSFSAIDMDRKNRLQKTRDLIYNDSDDENEREAITTSNNRASAATQDNAFDMIRNGNGDGIDDEIDENKQSERVDQMELSGVQEDNNGGNVNVSTIQFDSEEFNSQVIRRRLAELDDSDGGDSDDNDFGIWNFFFVYICYGQAILIIIIINCVLCTFFFLAVANEIDKITNDDDTGNRLNNTNKRERSIPDEYTAENDNNAVGVGADDDDDDDDGPIMRPQKKKAKLSIIDDDSDDD